MTDEIIAIIDRSASMGGYEKATMDGFNEFIGEQRSISEDANVTLVLFDHEYEVVYEALAIKDVPKLVDETYSVRGSTALRDALGKAINAAGLRFANAVEKPNKVIVSIFTDGEENSSQEFTGDKLKSMVTHQEEKYGWEFIYVGCDHDVIQASQDLGFKSINTLNISKSNIRGAYADMSSKLGCYRS